MEEEDEMSDVYGHHGPEHSAENKLVEEAEHCYFPFQEFDEFGGILQCLHTAGEMMTSTRMDMAEAKTETETETEAEAEAMVKEMEISDVMKDTVPLNEMAAVEETAKTEVGNEAPEREKMEVVDELPETEVVKEASETGVAEETGAEVKVSEVEVTKENTEIEAEQFRKETAEVVVEELVEVAKGDRGDGGGEIGKG